MFRTWCVPWCHQAEHTTTRRPEGIASILLERGGMGAWTSEEVNSDKRDVRNILSSLDMYQIRRDVRNYVPMEVTDVCYQAASEDGLWYPAAKPGRYGCRGRTARNDP